MNFSIYVGDSGAQRRVSLIIYPFAVSSAQQTARDADKIEVRGAHESRAVACWLARSTAPQRMRRTCAPT